MPIGCGSTLGVDLGAPEEHLEFEFACVLHVRCENVENKFTFCMRVVKVMSLNPCVLR